MENSQASLFPGYRMSTADKLLGQSPPSLNDSCLASVGNAGNSLRTSVREQECGWGVASPGSLLLCLSLLITKQERPRSQAVDSPV